MSSSSSSSATSLAVTAVVVATTSAAMYWWYNKKNAPIKVEALYVYPVKSCAPSPVKTTEVATCLGFVNDRIYQVVVKNASGKYEFCTPRDKKYQNLFKIQPIITNDGSSVTLTAPSITTKTIIVPSTDATSNSSKIIQTAVMCGPDVQAVDCGDDVAKWLDEVLLSDDCRLVSLSTKAYQRTVVVNPDQGEVLPAQEELPAVSFADESAYHLATRSSLQDLNRRMKERGKTPVPIERFRPNIVLSGGDVSCPPWIEDSWKKIRIGGKAEFHVWQRTGRCTMTTIDRSTLGRGPEPLATLSEFRERAHGQRNFGMHLIAVPQSVGGTDGGVTIRVGDTVEVLEYDMDRKAEWTELFG